MWDFNFIFKGYQYMIKDLSGDTSGSFLHYNWLSKDRKGSLKVTIYNVLSKSI